MKIKVTCITPPGQAEKAEKKLKKDLLFKTGTVLETEILSDSLFYWIIEIESKEMLELTKRAAKAERTVKATYKKIMWAARWKKDKFEDWDAMKEFLKLPELIKVENLD